MKRKLSEEQQREEECGGKRHREGNGQGPTPQGVEEQLSPGHSQQPWFADPATASATGEIVARLACPTEWAAHKAPQPRPPQRFAFELSAIRSQPPKVLVVNARNEARNQFSFDRSFNAEEEEEEEEEAEEEEEEDELEVDEEGDDKEESAQDEVAGGEDFNWTLALALAMAYASFVFCRSFFTVTQAAIKNDHRAGRLGLTDVQADMIITRFTLAYGFFKIPTGFVAGMVRQEFGLLMGCMLATAAVVYVAADVESCDQLSTLAVANALPIAMAYPAVTKLVNHHYTASKDRTRVFSLVSLGSRVGQTAAFWVLGGVLKRTQQDWRYALRATPLSIALALAAVAFARQQLVTRRTRRRFRQQQQVEEDEDAQHRRRQQEREESGHHLTHHRRWQAPQLPRRAPAIPTPPGNHGRGPTDREPGRTPHAAAAARRMLELRRSSDSFPVGAVAPRRRRRGGGGGTHAPSPTPTPAPDGPPQGQRRGAPRLAGAGTGRRAEGASQQGARGGVPLSYTVRFGLVNVASALLLISKAFDTYAVRYVSEVCHRERPACLSGTLTLGAGPEASTCVCSPDCAEHAPQVTACISIGIVASLFVGSEFFQRVTARGPRAALLLSMCALNVVTLLVLCALEPSTVDVSAFAESDEGLLGTIAVLFFLMGFAAGFPFYVPQALFAAEFTNSASIVGMGEAVQAIVAAVFIKTAQSMAVDAAGRTNWGVIFQAIAAGAVAAVVLMAGFLASTTPKTKSARRPR